MNDDQFTPTLDTLEQHERATEDASAEIPLRLPLYGRAPDPEVIREARLQAGITQDAAARLVYATPGAWSHWELGRAQMMAAVWELFCCKIARQAWYDRKMIVMGLPVGGPPAGAR